MIEPMAAESASGRKDQPVCPPLGGGDVELCNFIVGPAEANETGMEAARLLLAEFEGVPSERAAAKRPEERGAYDDYDGRISSDYAGMYRDHYNRGSYFARASASSATDVKYDPQDWGRKFSRSGSCAYVDLGHCEVCLPEISSAREYVKHYHAMLKNAAKAQAAANRKLNPHGRHLHVLASCSDGKGHSFGAHTNFLIGRTTFDRIASTRLHFLLFLASYQVSSIIFTGQGKVGAENGQDAVDYQLTQRGDFCTCVCALQTTFDRPLVNLRDEALVGPGSEHWARLHTIFYDASLCHVATYLKFGVMQIVLGLLACERVNLSLILEDPVAALGIWGRDLTLSSRCRTLLGEPVTAVELQWRFVEEARKFIDSGQCDLPDAANIMSLWTDTLTKLGEKNFEALAPRLDWVLKLTAIRSAMEENPLLNWQSPEVKCLDLMYASLDPGNGIYWIFERGGFTEQIVPQDEINRAVTEPPDDTRAWARAMLLRRFGSSVESIDWHRINFRIDRGGFGIGGALYRTLSMPDPLGMTRAQLQPIFEGDRSLDEVLDLLNAGRATSTPALAYAK